MQNSKVLSSSTDFSHPCPKNGCFDVFLSFRGKDTRYGFTHNLNHFLRENMVYTFMDVDLTGEDIEHLFKMVDKSRMAVVIYSESYASSDWCLKELDLILQRRKENKMLIIPIFYKVDVHELKHLTRNTKECLDKHVPKHGRTLVQKWMDVIKNFGNISGLSYKTSHNRPEYDFIMDVIGKIKKKLREVEETLESCIVKAPNKNIQDNLVINKGLCSHKNMEIPPILQLRQEQKSSSTQLLSHTNTTTGEEEFYRVVTCTYLQKSVEIMGKVPNINNRNLIEGQESNSTSLVLTSTTDKYVTFKRYSLDPWSGKKCIKLSARSLTIAWVDTPMYWKWIQSSEPKSSFEEVAMLKEVCWFDIWGHMDTELLSPGTCYNVYFIFKLVVNAFGFENLPVKVRVGVKDTADQAVIEKSVYLDIRRRREQQYQIVPKQRKDGWSEIEMGMFYVEDGGEAKELVMGVTEVNDYNWKGGIMVEGIEIRPKD